MSDDLHDARVGYWLMTVICVGVFVGWLTLWVAIIAQFQWWLLACLILVTVMLVLAEVLRRDAHREIHNLRDSQEARVSITERYVDAIDTDWWV